MMDDLVKRLRQTGNTRLKSEPTDDPKHYLNVVAKLSVSDGKMMLKAADRIEELEARVAAADKLAEAVTHEREMVCQDFGMQQDAATAVHNALAAYQATKEGG
jgi:uncharacterized coiled-coil protein SlyX